MTEEVRIKKFKEVESDLINQGYKGKEHTISILKANIMAFILAGPIAIFFLLAYDWVHETHDFGFSNGQVVLLFVLLIISMGVHEVLHGLGWSKFCQNKWKSIHIGVIWKALTPFCCCVEPLNTRAYVVGSILPLIVLGFGGSILAILMESPLLLALGIINIISAGGDVTILMMLLKQGHKKIMDHPTKCGFWAFGLYN